MSKSNYAAALDVIAGAYGNGSERVQKLTAAGYDATAVQSIVNALVRDGYKPPRLRTVEIDLAEYDGITLIFKNGGTAIESK